MTTSFPLKMRRFLVYVGLLIAEALLTETGRDKKNILLFRSMNLEGLTESLRLLQLGLYLQRWNTE